MKSAILKNLYEVLSDVSKEFSESMSLEVPLPFKMNFIITKNFPENEHYADEVEKIIDKYVDEHYENCAYGWVSKPDEGLLNDEIIIAVFNNGKPIEIVLFEDFFCITEALSAYIDDKYDFTFCDMINKVCEDLGVVVCEN